MPLASRNFNAKMALEKEIKDVYAKVVIESAPDAASAEFDLTTPVTIVNATAGDEQNGNTVTLEVEAPAANPTDTILADVTGTADAIVITITPNDGTNNPVDQATAVINLTADITLESVAAGSARNGNTFTLEVAAAAPNPTDTILADFTGTAAAIVCTITPNDGTNNAATPVDLTTAELVELINTGVVAGKTVTVTDASSLRNDQTAVGGDATVLADGGEGDGEVATFSGGTNPPVELTTAEFAELLDTGSVVGKTVTVTDAGSLLANIASASGGDATDLADGGEGDGEVATFEMGEDDISLSIGYGIASFTRNDVGDYSIVLQDAYFSLKNARAILLSTTAQDINFQLYSEDVDGVKSIRFLALSGATPTDFSAAGSVYFKFELKNSSVV